MTFYTNSEVAVAGGGLVGSLLSLFLANTGCKVQLIEKRSKSQIEQQYKGKSINLALSDRGFAALNKLNLSEKVKALSIPMYGRMIHNEAGTTSFYPYGKANQAIYSVSRHFLNLFLINEAVNNSNIEVRYQTALEYINHKSGSVVLKSENGTEEITYDAIFGADGAYSQVRQSLMKMPRFDYEQWYLKHGYKELAIPSANGDYAMDKNALHIWPRGNFMLIALPNLDGSFTCTLFMPYEGDNSFASLDSEENLTVFFKSNFVDALELMPNLVEDFFHNEVSSLINISCYPWRGKNSCLIGDAAHAIVPFYGQGMNAGFEDCRVFDDILTQASSWDEAFNLFQEERKPNADAIAELARRNFIEMSQLMADQKFILRKKIEQRLSTLYPDYWIPLYTMVTFSPEIPYAYALQKGISEDAIMEQILAMPNIESIWQSLDYKEFLSL